MVLAAFGKLFKGSSLGLVNEMFLRYYTANLNNYIREVRA